MISSQEIESNNQSVILIGFPFDEYSSYLKGAAKAPQAIRDAYNSESTNSFSESGLDLSIPDVLKDFGDVVFSSDEYVSKIGTSIQGILRSDQIPIALGGDHSITYPIVKAFHKKYPLLNILHFDAHPDLYDEFQGNRFSHACPFARIMEENLASRLIQLGIRTCTQHQRDQATKFGVEMIEMKDWTQKFSIDFEGPIYISFDLDVLDPAYAPGVSHHEPGGASIRQVLNVIQQLNCKIVGADVVELNPERDPFGITAMTAAKIVKEIAAKMIQNR